MTVDGLETGAWVLVAPLAALRALRPLIRAHERERPVRIVELQDAWLPTPSIWADLLVGADGLLLVGNRRRAPRTVFPGPFLSDSLGRAVPAGWLPDMGGDALNTFARSAARVVKREAPMLGPLALLGQWHSRFIYLADRMEVKLRGNGELPFRIFRWTSERITRDDLARGLRTGLGVAIYFGHGRPSGWAGYHGLRAQHLIPENAEPLGSLLSVTCRTASRWGVALSFSEAITLRGIAASSVGAVAPVEHVDNVRWMLGFADALRAGARDLGRALLLANPLTSRARNVYRIIGDPLAPLVGAADSERRAAKIWAPSPNQVLA